MSNKVLLEFKCGDCSLPGIREVTMTFDLSSQVDKEALWTWLQTHCANGGTYTTIMQHENQDVIDKLIADGWEPTRIPGEYGRIQLTKHGITLDSKNLR